MIVLLIMAVLLLAGTTFLTISSTESEIAVNQRATARAFALAEAALHRAIARLSVDATYGGESNVSLGGGLATISVSNAPLQICLSKDLDVSASVPVRSGQARARIKATADQAVYPFQWGLLAANGPLSLLSDDVAMPARLDSYDSRLGVYDRLTNGSGSVTVGAIGGGVELRNVELIGSAAGDTVTSTPTAVDSLGRPGDAPMPLPEAAGPWMDSVVVGDDASLAMSAGTHYLESLTLGNRARLTLGGAPVTIYLHGAFTAGDQVTVGAEATGADADDKLSLIMNSGTGSPSEFTAGAYFRMFGSLYGTNTNVVLGPGAVIRGAFVARTISGPGGPGEPCCNGRAPTLHFDRAMTRRPVCTQGFFSMRRGTWREVLP